MNDGLRHISPKAIIGKNCTILPFTYIEDDVVIGDNCWIGSNVSIMNGARIGDNCKIFPNAVISAIPQDLKYKNEDTKVIIGNGVTIRECVTVNRGTIANWETVVGDNSLLMAYVHVAHDCIIGKRCILANNATLAGHIEIGDFATLGGMTAVHQFVKIGESAMIGGGSLVRKDVPPFVTAAREPLSYAGVNTTGLRRRQFSPDIIHHIEDIYRNLFVRGHFISEAVSIIEAQVPQSIYRDQILSFVRGAKRGLMRGFSSSAKPSRSKLEELSTSNNYVSSGNGLPNGHVPLISVEPTPNGAAAQKAKAIKVYGNSIN